MLTGFEAFSGLDENPSELVVRHIGDMSFERFEVRTAVLPVEFISARKRIISLVNDKNWTPEVVLCMGVSPSRNWISIERIAVNIMDSIKGDNAGFSPSEIPVTKGTPLARKSSLPVKKIADAINASGTPAKVSNTAGTYVCNTVMYAALGACVRRNIPCGFIHLPSTETIDVKMMEDSILVALQTI